MVLPEQNIEFNFQKPFCQRLCTGFVAENALSDVGLARLCDIVENALEGIVLQFRGHFFEEGMEEKLHVEFEVRLATLIREKGADMDSLPENQKQYIQNRIKNALELFHKEYES